MVKLFRMYSNLCDHNPPTSQTDIQTDRQTTCDRNTTLCTKVHRAVKMNRTVAKYIYSAELSTSSIIELHKLWQVCIEQSLSEGLQWPEICFWWWAVTCISDTLCRDIPMNTAVGLWHMVLRNPWWCYATGQWKEFMWYDILYTGRFRCFSCDERTDRQYRAMHNWAWGHAIKATNSLLV